MATPYVIAMDTDNNIAHAYRAGSPTTECQQPADKLETGDTSAFANRSFSLCRDCREAWAS
jgi:hypothetical protein